MLMILFSHSPAQVLLPIPADILVRFSDCVASRPLGILSAVLHGFGRSPLGMGSV